MVLQMLHTTLSPRTRTRTTLNTDRTCTRTLRTSLDSSRAAPHTLSPTTRTRTLRTPLDGSRDAPPTHSPTHTDRRFSHVPLTCAQTGRGHGDCAPRALSNDLTGWTRRAFEISFSLAHLTIKTQPREAHHAHSRSEPPGAPRTPHRTNWPRTSSRIFR